MNNDEHRKVNIEPRGPEKDPLFFGRPRKEGAEKSEENISDVSSVKADIQSEEMLSNIDTQKINDKAIEEQRLIAREEYEKTEIGQDDIGKKDKKPGSKLQDQTELDQGQPIVAGGKEENLKPSNIADQENLRREAKKIIHEGGKRVYGGKEGKKLFFSEKEESARSEALQEAWLKAINYYWNTMLKPQQLQYKSKEDFGIQLAQTVENKRESLAAQGIRVSRESMIKLIQEGYDVSSLDKGWFGKLVLTRNEATRDDNDRVVKVKGIPVSIKSKDIEQFLVEHRVDIDQATSEKLEEKWQKGRAHYKEVVARKTEELQVLQKRAQKERALREVAKNAGSLEELVGVIEQMGKLKDQELIANELVSTIGVIMEEKDLVERQRILERIKSKTIKEKVIQLIEAEERAKKTKPVKKVKININLGKGVKLRIKSKKGR